MIATGFLRGNIFELIRAGVKKRLSMRDWMSHEFFQALCVKEKEYSYALPQR
jgi:hypothetical protein